MRRTDNRTRNVPLRKAIVASTTPCQDLCEETSSRTSRTSGRGARHRTLSCLDIQAHAIRTIYESDEGHFHKVIDMVVFKALLWCRNLRFGDGALIDSMIISPLGSRNWKMECLNHAIRRRTWSVSKRPHHMTDSDVETIPLSRLRESQSIYHSLQSCAHGTVLHNEYLNHCTSQILSALHNASYIHCIRTNVLNTVYIHF
jgi:hypothetical protein